jgi:hypothetical protein
MLLVNECLFLLFISLSTQSGNFWAHPCMTGIVDGTCMTKGRYFIYITRGGALASGLGKELIAYR